jgi:hypothetical protein
VPTKLAAHPRPPLTVQVDAGLRTELVTAALRVSFLRQRVAGLLIIATLVGLLGWLSTRRPAIGLSIGLGAALLLGLASLLLTVKRVRAVARPGTTITSGYDEFGRLLLIRNTGELVVGPSPAVVRRGRIAVVERCPPLPHLVTPGELITPDDAEMLTRVPAPLPWSITLTVPMRRELLREARLSVVRSPLAMASIALLILNAFWLFLLDPGVAIVPVGVLAGVFACSGAYYRHFVVRTGRTIHAGMDDAGLSVIGWGPRDLTFAAPTHVTRTKHALVLRRRVTRYVLPRDLIPDEHFEQVYRALAGR